IVHLVTSVLKWLISASPRPFVNKINLLYIIPQKRQKEKPHILFPVSRFPRKAGKKSLFFSDSVDFGRKSVYTTRVRVFAL
ncbi:MAG: hypothetical protein MJ075_01230, partial [Oscillospiraceae bacterium]|nr:hypothetical protein [Oscillospiraceae bacterium]